MTQLSTSAELTAASPEERLAALGITLPPAPQPIANFVTHVVEGNMLYLSGQGTREADGHMRTGKVGAEISTSRPMTMPASSASTSSRSCEKRLATFLGSSVW